jgi:hypothetical protein
VKLGISGSLERVENEEKLDSAEVIKYRFLKRYFFRPKHSLGKQKLKYYDSMIVKYPELTSIKFYKDLITKITDYDSLKFNYTTKRIPLTDKEYRLLIDSLKNSNFTNLPWRVQSPESVMDGTGYAFEANTKTKFKYFVCYGLPIDTLQMTKYCRYLLKVAKMDNEIKL